jgi:hypothetical protein
MTTTGIVLTENRHAGGFMVSEAPGRYSRQAILIAASQNLIAGQILGLATAGDGSFAAGAAAAVAGNTGNGTVSAPSVGVGVQAGSYRMVAISATEFELFDPSGNLVGIAKTGTAFATQIGFTITAGGTAFVAGDSFTVAVTETDPSDAGQYVALGVSSAVTSAATASSSAVLHFAGGIPSLTAPGGVSVPAIIAGMVVADLTTAGVIPAGTTVLSVSTSANTVTMSANAAAGGVVLGDAITFTATDGSQNPAAISWANVNTVTSGATAIATAIVREAEVRGVDLTYPAGASAAQITAINAALLAPPLGIVVR